MKNLFPAAATALVFLLIPVSHAQNAFNEPTEEFMRAKAISATDEREDQNPEDNQRKIQTVQLRITSGRDKGKEFAVENVILNGRSDMRINEGETIIVRKIVKSDGSILYQASEKYRLPAILWLGLFFLILAILLGGWTGISSIGGLAVSILILTLYVVPKIAGGGNPLAASLIGSFAIACTSLYLAHGFTRRTSVALLSTLVTLVIATALSFIFVYLAKLFGMGSEESMFLQTGAFQNVNLRGLLLGGIIIGCLGVLDDVTTAQTAAIDEIWKANPSIATAQLWKAGMSVGREHIASLINTLALAYAGASLPLLLLFKLNDSYPLWVTLNSEFLAEEIIRTLVGSATLLFAVPISTWVAANLLKGTDASSSAHGKHFH